VCFLLSLIHINNRLTAHERAKGIKMKLLQTVVFAAALSILPATVTNAETDVAVVSEQAQQAAVNINTADVKQLAKLPGIGKKKAQAIIDYRQAQGAFTSLDDLTKVKGIGKKLLAKLDGKISL
jgi:competence protein ComEA